MKLDTSSYYPPSPLDDEPEEEVIVEIEKEEIARDDVRRDAPGDSMGDRKEDAMPSGGERLADGVATFLSWALVPLLMPVYGVLLAFNVSILDFTPMSVKTVFTLVTAAFTVAVPALLVF